MAVYLGSNEVNLRGGQPMENGLPSGGLTGQVLAKSSNDDYVAAWTTVYDIPAGGSVGQVLAKSSDDDYAFAWTSIESGENDFYIPVTKSGNNYSTTVTRTELYDAYNGGKNLFVKYGNLIFPFSSLSSYYFKFKLLQGSDGDDYLTGQDITINGTDMSITYLKFWKNVLPYSQSSYSGRYLKHGSTANSFSWSTINQVPSGGTYGQVLTKVSSGYSWKDAGLPVIYIEVGWNSETQQWDFVNLDPLERYQDIEHLYMEFNNGCSVVLVDNDDFATVSDYTGPANFYYLTRVWVTEHSDEYDQWQNVHLLFSLVDDTNGTKKLKTFELVSRAAQYNGLNGETVSVTYSEHSIGSNILICEITRVGYNYTSSMTKAEIETAINLGEKVILAFNYDPMYYPCYIGSCFYIDDTTHLPKASVSYITDGDELIVAFIEIDDYDVISVHRHGKTITWDWDEQGQ